jgi:hypothetical protein
MSQLTRSEIRKFIIETSSGNNVEKKLINEVSLPSSDDIKKMMTEFIRENAKAMAEKISEKSIYGTQTVVAIAVEETIHAQADELANCFVDLLNPFE